MSASNGEVAAFAQPIPLQFQKVVLVGTWGQDLKSEVCGICKNSLIDNCVTCMNTLQGEGDPARCPLVRGSCGHSFHDHCIQQWVSKNNTCSTCMQKWTLAEHVSRE